MVQEYADYLDSLRLTSDSAVEEKHTVTPKDVFRKMNTSVAIGKIDEHSQITEKGTGWSKAYLEKLRAAGYDGMDIPQAWYWGPVRNLWPFSCLYPPWQQIEQPEIWRRG